MVIIHLQKSKNENIERKEQKNFISGNVDILSGKGVITNYVDFTRNTETGGIYQLKSKRTVDLVIEARKRSRASREKSYFQANADLLGRKRKNE